MPVESADPRLVERTVLENGLTVVRQPAPPAARSFSATFVAPGGWAYDPEGRHGLAVFTTALLTSGAGRYDRVALSRLLDGYGATLSARPAPESSEVTIWGPSSVLDPLLDLLAEVVLRPRFDADDIERVRRQIHERQLRELRQPDGRAERDLLRAIFPEDHPYRRTGIGEPASVRRIHRADLRAFHGSHFVAPGSFLVVTGPPSLDALVRDAKVRFRQFPTEVGPPAPAVPEIGRPSGTQRVPMPGHSQVEIRIGGPSIARSAYHGSREVEAMRWGGLWEVHAGTGPERVDRAVRLIEQELTRIVEERIPGTELDRIRESAIGELPLALETTSGAHELAVDIAYHGLPDDHLVEWPKVLRTVTPSEIREAVVGTLDPGRSVRVLAGPLAPPASSKRRR